VLKRGFAMIKSEDGKFLSSKAAAETKEKFSIKFFDGEMKVIRKT
jgi:exodeoxyribonuclease VII large subunit